MGKKLIVVNVFLLIIGLSLKAQEADFASSDTLGCDSLTVQFTDQSTGAATWLWDFGDGHTSTDQNPSHQYASPGAFNVSLTITNNGDSLSETKNSYIRVLPKPDSIFWFNDTLTLGSYNYVFVSPLQVGEANNNIDYNRQWLISDGSGYTLRRFVHTFEDTGIYIVQLNINIDLLPQCQSSLTRRVLVRDEIYIPNVFSPNYDRYNDLFIVEYNGITNLNIYIYSRFGNLVFKTTAPVITWDGIGTNGQEMNEGVYYYVLTSDDGEVSKTGFFHLYR